MAKKPAITGISRPQGFIDDTAKAIGKAMKKTRSAGEFISDVGSDRYARMRYSTIPKAKKKVYRKVEDIALNNQAKKQITRKMAPSKDDRAFYRAERKQEIRMEGGPFSYKAPKKKPPQPPKKSGIKPPSMRTNLGKGKPAMTTKELDAYRKMQGFDKTVSDIKKPKKKIR
jgi:hypothetical protein